MFSIRDFNLIFQSDISIRYFNQIDIENALVRILLRGVLENVFLLFCKFANKIGQESVTSYCIIVK